MELRDYEAIFEDLPSLERDWNKVLLGKKQAYSGGASYAIFGLISENKRKLALSPVMLMKAQKNEVPTYLSNRDNFFYEIDNCVITFVSNFELLSLEANHS